MPARGWHVPRRPRNKLQNLRPCGGDAVLRQDLLRCLQCLLPLQYYQLCRDEGEDEEAVRARVDHLVEVREVEHLLPVERLQPQVAHAIVPARDLRGEHLREDHNLFPLLRLEPVVHRREQGVRGLLEVALAELVHHVVQRERHKHDPPDDQVARRLVVHALGHEVAGHLEVQPAVHHLASPQERDVARVPLKLLADYVRESKALHLPERYCAVVPDRHAVHAQQRVPLAQSVLIVPRRVDLAHQNATPVGPLRKLASVNLHVCSQPQILQRRPRYAERNEPLVLSVALNVG
mmetsp:Transcript_65342/g.160889  ORF Transcript_65342/g.160889 Transcript_65342/m.160889 type:complete len:292 (-) Transcript_65342:734-1609(-)